MTDIDLIPRDFRTGISLQRQLRRFIVACIVVLAGVAVARLSLGYLIWREKAMVVRIEQQQLVLEHNQAKTEQLRQQRQVTEQQLAALDKLRGRDRVALFLGALDQAYNEHIWLDSVHFLRRSGTGALANAPGAANAGLIVVPEAAGSQATLSVMHGADLYGHAINHSELAQFMQLLGAQPVVADLRLLSTATRSYTDTQVIDFNLSLQVEDKAPVQR
jgi:cell division protein FtsB